MLLNQFNLEKKPFAMPPDPDLMVWTAQHERAQKALLHHTVSGHGIALLTGEVGCGKTTILQDLLQNSVVRETCKTILISIRLSTAGEVLQHILMAFGASLPECNDQDALAIVMNLLEKAKDQNLSTVLIVDEAQTLSTAAALQLVELDNCAAKASLPFSIILTGQPELEAWMANPVVAPLKAAIRNHITLCPLSKQEVSDFIHGRLKHAGASGPAIFEDSAIEAIWDFSGGIPRLINKACEMCMFSAARDGVDTIDGAFAFDVFEDFSPIGAPDVIADSPADAPEETDTPVEDTVRPIEIDRALLQKLTDATSSETADEADIEHILAQKPARQKKSRKIYPVFATVLALCAIPTGLWYTDQNEDAQPIDLGVSGVTFAAQKTVEPQKPIPKTELIAQEQQKLLDLQRQTSQAEEKLAALTRQLGLAAQRLDDTQHQVDEKAAAFDALNDEITTSQATLQKVISQISNAEQKLQNTAAIQTLTPLDLAGDDPAPYFSEALGNPEPNAIAINFSRAAIRGHRLAATFLGQLYETGDGVSFSPEVAQRWYQIASGAQPEVGQKVAPAHQEIAPMAALVDGKTADFVWSGRAQNFTLELARADHQPIAIATTGLTAISVDLPSSAAFWRVKTDAGQTFDWQPLNKN